MKCELCGTKLKDYLFQVNGRATWGEGCDTCESVINLRPALGYCYMKQTSQEEFAKMYPPVSGLQNKTISDARKAAHNQIKKITNKRGVVKK